MNARTISLALLAPLLALPCSAEKAAPAAPSLQSAIFAARDAVLPALVHVEPIIEVYARGQKSKAAVTGSGVIVDLEGHVLTNDHVVAHAQRVRCILYDKREMTARVVARDSLTDVAVLQLDLQGQSVPTAILGSSATLEAGQHVIAMGSPLGLARSLSVGVVSTPDRYFPENFLPTGDITGTYNTWIQTDAAINPGNSGGPLVDLLGHVVGINARAVPIFGENLGFAIPIDVVKEVAADLIAKGHVERSWIGVTWQETKSLADYFGVREGGVVVGGVVGEAPAARAGLLPGDIVTSWNGTPVSVRFEEQLPRFRKLVADTPVGAKVPVKIVRRAAEMTLEVTTIQQPEAESEEAELASWGLTVRDVTPELARRRRIDDPEGALVTGVKEAAPAAVAGLQEGDVVRDIEGTRVKSTQELLDLFRTFDQAGRDHILVRFSRGATKRMAVLVLAP